MGKESSEQKKGSEEEEFRLVGFSKFVRTNPKSDLYEIQSFHHVEFWCGDATNTSRRFSWGLGLPLAAKSDLSTGNRHHASYLLSSDELRFLFTAPYAPTISTPDSDAATIPSFSRSDCLAFSAAHGLAVRAIALQVSDAARAFDVAVSRGAIPSFSPASLGDGAAQMAEVRLYGDVVLRFVSLSSADGVFLPGFEAVPRTEVDYGLRRLDHAVGNVPELGPAVEYMRKITGFHEFAEFSGEDVGTGESGLNSVVLANNEERVLMPVNEPVHGTKRQSQIQTYLDHNGGAGVQHLALASQDIFGTLRHMRACAGFDFMPPPPPTYYRNLRLRAAHVLTPAQMQACQDLGVLVDCDSRGTLLQIFTKPVGDRPTLFLEIIQRLGCISHDALGNSFQEPGCGGFGKGNFSELFKSIEEYEKTLLQSSNSSIII